MGFFPFLFALRFRTFMFGRRSCFSGVSPSFLLDGYFSIFFGWTVRWPHPEATPAPGLAPTLPEYSIPLYFNFLTSPMEARPFSVSPEDPALFDLSIAKIVSPALFMFPPVSAVLVVPVHSRFSC